MKLKERYSAPTPILYRKIGDALLATSTTITSFAIVEDYKWLALSACLIGAVGKFISNLFSE